MPYIEECYQETMKLGEYGSSDVTKSSLKALANFTIAVYDYNKKMADTVSDTGNLCDVDEILGCLSNLND